MFEDIKPHKTFKNHGITYVSEIVAPPVKAILELLHNNPGSYIRWHNILNFARLVIPDQPEMIIEQGYNLSILEYCKAKDNYIGDNIKEYELAPGAMDWIRKFTNNIE